MQGNKVILFLLLATSGIVGCATSERLYHRTLTSAAQLPPPMLAPANALNPSITPSFPKFAAPAVSETQKPAELESAIVLRDPIEPPITKAADIKVEHDEARDKPPKPTSPPAPAANPTRVAAADNRLLDLLEKDLDKAVEQARQRRRLQFSKEVVGHPRVRYFIKQYSTANKGYFETLLIRSGKYMPLIAKVLSDEGLPEELGYLALLESEFNVNTTSPSGAAGLWQFVPTTARQYGLRIDDWVDERRDPVKSTRAAAAYLKDLHQYYGRWYLATAAYNAGQSAIDKAMQSSGAKDFWSLSQKARLSEETRNFVPKFVAISLIATEPKKYGFNNLRYEEPLEYDEVDAEGLLKIDALAEMSESDAVTMKDLNPALLRNITPPGEKGYRIRVPLGKSLVFANASEYLRAKEPAQVLTHEVKRGETLVSIAKRYGQAVSMLMAWNGLTTPRLQIGQKLRILLEGIRGTLR
jgi:membrane-bound lytic murein transglycosylase D